MVVEGKCRLERASSVTWEPCSKHVGGSDTAAWEALIEMEKFDLQKLASHTFFERFNLSSVESSWIFL